MDLKLKKHFRRFYVEIKISQTLHFQITAYIVIVNNKQKTKRNIYLYQLQVTKIRNTTLQILQEPFTT